MHYVFSCLKVVARLTIFLVPVKKFADPWIRPYQSKAHRSDDLFINAAIMQLATYEIDITIEQPSFGQKVGPCSSGEVWRHNGLSAPKHVKN